MYIRKENLQNRSRPLRNAIFRSFLIFVNKNYWLVCTHLSQGARILICTVMILCGDENNDVFWEFS